MHDVVRPPFAQNEGAVDGDVLRHHPIVAMALDQMLWHRQGRVVFEQVRQICGRIFELNFKREIVERGDAEIFRRHVAAIHRFRVFDRIKQRCVFSQIRRIQDAAERVFEIMRVARFPVRPLRTAQMKRPGAAVGAGFPALGHARHRFGLFIFGGEPDEHVANNVVFPGAGSLVRVERERLGLVGDVKRARRLVEADHLTVGASAQRRRAPRARKQRPATSPERQRFCSPALHLTLLRIERVTQPVTQEIERQQRDQHGDRGRDQQPGRVDHLSRAIGDEPP